MNDEEEIACSAEVKMHLEVLLAAHQVTLAALNRAEQEIAETRLWFETRRRSRGLAQ